MNKGTCPPIASFLIGLFLVSTLTEAKPKSDGLNLTWRQTDRSVAVLNQGRVVWQHVHDRKVGKPYMRIGMIDGTELTRPWPIPKGYPKADHVWHRSLWWSWKAIDGVNYWEQHQQGTDPIAVTITRADDDSARIDATITYHRPGETPVAKEQRVIDVSAPTENGTYLITWRATFTPGRDKGVLFNRNSYGGLALRMAAVCCGDPQGGKPAWTFLDSEGRTDSNNKRARWVAYRGTAANGKPAAVAIFDHPANPRHPSWWQTRSHYPYLNPSLTCNEDYSLAAGASLTLRYGILVHHGTGGAEAIERAWKAFADKN